MLNIKKDKLAEIYRKMLSIRLFEEEIFHLFVQGILPGTLHQYIGQEAVAVGVCENLRKEDLITSNHRPHGHYIAKGGRIEKLAAELLARKDGCCKAKGGSMHIGEITVGMVPATAIVAAGIPIAVGIGLSLKMKGTDRVVACFFGDGAVQKGDFHEGINLAAIWKLPVIFVCENNMYAASTHYSKATLLKNLAEASCAYGIPGLVVDGNDVVAVYNVVGEAVERARAGNGPTLIECKTYRQCGHSRSDPAKYRAEEEVKEWMKRDPIIRFKERMIGEGVFCEEEIVDIEKKVKEEIIKAIEFAQSRPLQIAEAALEDI